MYYVSFMHTWCELAEVLVAAGVIADGSVDHALRGKHLLYLTEVSSLV